MGFELVKYETACRALAEARRVDEVKSVRDIAMAMRLYAKQAKNKQLEADAFEIRLRAEKRVGEMMEAQPKARGGGDQKSDHRVSEKPGDPFTLAEAGIDKNLAHRARRLNALPDEDFERVVSEGRSAIERAIKAAVGDDTGEDCPDCATPEEARRLGFLNVAAGVVAYASRHDLSADAIDREMVDAAEEAAAAWTCLAADLRGRL